MARHFLRVARMREKSAARGVAHMTRDQGRVKMIGLRPGMIRSDVQGEAGNGA